MKRIVFQQDSQAGPRVGCSVTQPHTTHGDARTAASRASSVLRTWISARRAGLVWCGESARTEVPVHTLSSTFRGARSTRF